MKSMALLLVGFSAWSGACLPAYANSLTFSEVDNGGAPTVTTAKLDGSQQNIGGPVILNCGRPGPEGSFHTDYMLSLDMKSDRFLLLDSDGNEPKPLKIQSTNAESIIFARIDGFDFSYEVSRELLDGLATEGDIIEGGTDNIGGPTSQACIVDSRGSEGSR